MARFWFKIGLKKLIHMFEWARMRVLDCHRSTNPTTASLILNGARLLGAPTDPLVTMFASLHVIGVGRRASLRFDDGCVERRRYPISVGIFFSVWEKSEGRRWHRPASQQIHVISSRPSPTFIGLDRHEAGWPWFDYVSRSQVYRPASCL